MKWPSNTDYFEAIQNPNSCFRESGLRAGSPITDSRGLPVASSGNFAIVFQFQCGKKRYAIKCFTTPLNDRSIRYPKISAHIKKCNLPYFVDFDFLSDGISVSGRSYPVVKMEWVDGEGLDRYVANNLNNSSALRELADKFFKMIKRLEEVGITHGDLQHGNIIVVNNELKLVDYDGVFVPSLNGMRGTELGLPNYQHPSRKPSDFGPSMDRFSAWIIYVSLLSIAADPTLWGILNGGDDCLLFRRDDFVSPSSSTAVYLATKRLEELGVDLTDFKKTLDATTPNDVPNLRSITSSPEREMVSQSSVWYSDLVPHSPQVALSPTISSQQPHNSLVGASWIIDHLAPLTPVSFGRIGIEIRLLAVLAYSGIVLCLGATIVTQETQLIVAVGTCFILSGGVGILSTYHNRPELKTKNQLRFQCRETAKFNSSQEGSLHDLDGELTRISKEELNLIEVARVARTKIEYDKTTAIHKLEQEFRGQNDQLSKSVRELDGELTKCLDSALRDFQRNYLLGRLANERIDDAMLAGIGPSLKLRLASHGINSAGDFVKVYSSTNWGDATRTYFQKSNGTSVHVEGIGAAKGSILLKWRHELIRLYSARVPGSLPQNEIQKIKSSIDVKRQALLVKSASIKKSFDSESKRIVEQTNTLLQKNRVSTENQLTKLREQANTVEVSRAAQKQTVQKCKSEWAILQREMQRYQAITLVNYASRVLFWNKG